MPRKGTATNRTLSKDIKTSAELRRVLLDTIRGVRAGDVDYRQGNTVATLSKAVIASAKLDFEVLRFHQEIEKEQGDSELVAIELSK